MVKRVVFIKRIKNIVQSDDLHSGKGEKEVDLRGKMS